MASPTYRQKANAGGSAAADVTCNVPATTADDDILIFFLSKDATGAVTWPGGWNILNEDTANTFYGGVGWRRAASEPASYTWTFASTWRDCIMVAYQGCVTGENPLDPDAPNAFAAGTVATGTQTFNTPNDTTTTINTVALALCNYKAISSFGAVPSGYTFRQNGAGIEVGVADLAVAGTGPIGVATYTVSGSGGAIKTYLLALQSVAASTPAMPPGLGPVVQMSQPMMIPPP